MADMESDTLRLALKEIDENDEIDVTSWEAGFIESVLYGSYKGPLSEKQRSTILSMCEQYGVEA